MSARMQTCLRYPELIHPLQRRTAVETRSSKCEATGKVFLGEGFAGAESEGEEGYGDSGDEAAELQLIVGGRDCGVAERAELDGVDVTAETESGASTLGDDMQPPAPAPAPEDTATEDPTDSASELATGETLAAREEEETPAAWGDSFLMVKGRAPTHDDHYQVGFRFAQLMTRRTLACRSPAACQTTLGRKSFFG